MYRNKKISLVIPAYREEKLIDQTLSGIPDLIDRIYVVDDCSPDEQNKVIERCAETDPRIQLLKHQVNQGPGGAIITGYLQSSKDNFDIAVVVGGDFQMNLNEVSRFLDPIIDGQADYTKGNRFLREQLEKTIGSMPKLRLIANWLITGLTKMASGYFNIMDVVDGYTAISKEAIDTINWSRAWKRYGYPMDFLIRLNAYCFRVKDIPRSAIYLPGVRQSQINGWKYAFQVTPMLVRNFLWRLKFKYVYLDFHPLVLFYLLAFVLVPTGLLAGIGLIADKVFFEGTYITAPRTILIALCLISGFQFFLFAMLFDREETK